MKKVFLFLENLQLLPGQLLLSFRHKNIPLCLLLLLVWKNGAHQVWMVVKMSQHIKNGA